MRKDKSGAEEQVMSEPQNQEPEQKPSEQEPVVEQKPTEHPQFDKRIKALDGKLHAIEEKHAREKQVWEQTQNQGREQFSILSKQYSDLTETLDKIEGQVSLGPAPDYEEDPKAYTDWHHNQVLQEIKRTAKTPTLQPTPTPPPTKNLPPFQQMPAQEAAQAAIHDDYYEVIEEVNQDMHADPALKNAIFAEQNPFKAAYDYGMRKKKIASDLRQGTLSQGYVEGDAPPAPAHDSSKLTPEEKTVVANMVAGGYPMTEEKYLLAKQRIAKAKGR
jgi:hypothetical protein